MNEYLFGLGLALWFGILTSISPCPLATNIAAMSFIAHKAGNARGVIGTGIAYCTGRIFAYVILGIIVINGVLAIPTVSYFLQKYLNLLLGPLLVLIGMFLLELLDFPLNSFKFSEQLEQRLRSGGIFHNFLLGALFALTFCPVSAALFFGSLIPLAIKLSSPVMPAVFFGFGTGLPVMLVTVFLVSGIKSVAGLFDRITKVERWIRTATGGIIVMAGIYLSLANIFQIF
ncbi:MAG: sulfite exporter TauE/SafE family protein [Oligoflexales bacterium]|nr:sulfite exporter TauE/SafE family protein [Oligoflexales bacterium]